MIPNFRDPLQVINVAAGDVILYPEGRILRSGNLDFIAGPSELKGAKTILNLRKGPDLAIDDRWGIKQIHKPKEDDFDVYLPDDGKTKRWLTSVVKLFESEDIQFPILIHCAFGMDRTGVVIATLLKILGVPDDTIAFEYSLSGGGSVYADQLIRGVLDDIGDPKEYFCGTDLDKVVDNILGESDASHS